MPDDLEELGQVAPRADRAKRCVHLGMLRGAGCGVRGAESRLTAQLEPRTSHLRAQRAYGT
jgi:hypothetical protein